MLSSPMTAAISGVKGRVRRNSARSTGASRTITSQMAGSSNHPLAGRSIHHVAKPRKAACAVLRNITSRVCCRSATPP